jgi:MFS family permease
MAAPSLTRNIRLFPWYRACVDAMAWLPIFFLYFSERVALHDVLLLEAAYYATIVVLEVPSGYFSDRFGRRVTLLLSSWAFCIAYLTFAAAGDFPGLLVAQVLLGLGMTLRSGTDTAMHYDSLVALGRSGDFAQREALAERAGLTSLGICSLLGGLGGLVDLRLAYGLSLIGALAALVVVWQFTEPGGHAHWQAAERSFARQLRRCAGYLKLPAVLWFLGFFVALDVLMHVPYEFYQPYLKLLEQGPLLADSSAAVSGAMMATTMGIAAFLAGHSVWIRDRLGLPALLLSALALQAAIVVVMSIWLSLATALIIALRNVPDALTHAPFNAALGKHLQSAHRATFLSVLNLTGRVVLSVLLSGLAWWLAPDSTADWATLSDLLAFCATLGCAALALLAISLKAIGEHRR